MLVLPKYRKALITTTHRYDLQGQPVEEVTIEQQELAQSQLTEYAEREKKFDLIKREKIKLNNRKRN